MRWSAALVFVFGCGGTHPAAVRGGVHHVSGTPRASTKGDLDCPIGTWNVSAEFDLGYAHWC